MATELAHPATTDINPHTNEEACEPKSPGTPVAPWKKLITWCFRLIVGGIFMFSGFVKAVDPLGTVYKFEEYFSVMGLEDFSAAALPLAFILFSLEFVVGASLLLGCYRKSMPFWGALFMIAMLPLTLWIALSDPVADCGCFGDAVRISNWATFWKNVVLAGMIVWLIIYNRSIKPLIEPSLQWLAFLSSLALPVVAGWISYTVQPLIDFRPYPIGTSMREEMPADAKTSDEGESFIGVWTDGETTLELPLDSIPQGDSWEFVERKEAATPSEEAASEPGSLALYSADEESLPADDAIASTGTQILICFNSLKNISAASYYLLNSLYNFCTTHEINLIAIAAATPEQIAEFRDLSLAEYPFFTAEDTAVKELVRGNPGIVYLKNGRIVWKSRLSALPVRDFVTSATPSALENAGMRSEKILTILWLSYAIFIALLMVAGTFPKLYRFFGGLRKNRFVRNSMCITLAASLLLTSCSNDEPADESIESVTLVYMVATNSLASNFDSDLDEIKAATNSLNLESNRLLVYYVNPESDGALYSLTRDGIFEKIYGIENNLYSVDPEVMRTVFNKVRTTYPAESYGLVLWSHGSGWIPGQNSLTSSAPERTWGDDYGRSIDIPELADAIPSGMFSYIWFDCCLMGGVECVYELRDKASFIVTHPTEIMAEGAPYTEILPYLCRKQPDLIGAAEAEWNYYSVNSNSMGHTVTIVETEKLNALAAEAHAIQQAARGEFVATAGLQTYGSYSYTDPQTQKRVGVPFYDLAEYYRRLCPPESQQQLFAAFSAALSDAVVYARATEKFGNIVLDPDQISGLSTFVPLSPSALGFNSNLNKEYSSLDWAKAIDFSRYYLSDQ